MHSRRIPHFTVRGVCACLLAMYAVYFGRTSLSPLHGTVLRFLSDSGTFFTRIETPHAGEEVLPLEARESARILDEMQIHEFQTSPAFNHRDFNWQQIITTAWPKKLEPGARYHLVPPSEAVPKNCKAVVTKKAVRLLDCSS